MRWRVDVTETSQNQSAIIFVCITHHKFVFSLFYFFSIIFYRMLYFHTSLFLKFSSSCNKKRDKREKDLFKPSSPSSSTSVDNPTWHNPSISHSTNKHSIKTFSRLIIACDGDCDDVVTWSHEDQDSTKCYSSCSSFFIQMTLSHHKICTERKLFSFPVLFNHSPVIRYSPIWYNSNSVCDADEKQILSKELWEKKGWVTEVQNILSIEIQSDGISTNASHSDESRIVVFEFPPIHSLYDSCVGSFQSLWITCNFSFIVCHDDHHAWWSWYSMSPVLLLCMPLPSSADTEN